jgi:hypothetical protein
MAKALKTSERPARRKIALRRDSTVGNAEREIERVFRLPRGSIRLVNPDHRKARSDKLVGALLADWGW